LNTKKYNINNCAFYAKRKQKCKKNSCVLKGIIGLCSKTALESGVSVITSLIFLRKKAQKKRKTQIILRYIEGLNSVFSVEVLKIV
jgi:hypothetical protein